MIEGEKNESSSSNKDFFKRKWEETKEFFKKYRKVFYFIIAVVAAVTAFFFLDLNIEQDLVEKKKSIDYTSLCSIFALFVGAAALGRAFRGDPEHVQAIKENTKALQDLRNAIMKQGNNNASKP